MRLYLAGKIHAGDWRHSIVDNLRGLPHSGAWAAESPWPVSPRAVFGLIDYVGPYFVSDDHGCAHGENTHGVGLGVAVCDDRKAHHRPMIARRCMEALQQADTVFAWLDTMDAYGSLVEIGAAHALGKRLWIAGPHRAPDLWFIYEMAGKTTFQFSAARQALRFLLGYPLDQPTPTRQSGGRV